MKNSVRSLVLQTQKNTFKDWDNHYELFRESISGAASVKSTFDDQVKSSNVSMKVLRVYPQLTNMTLLTPNSGLHHHLQQYREHYFLRD